MQYWPTTYRLKLLAEMVTLTVIRVIMARSSVQAFTLVIRFPLCVGAIYTALLLCTSSHLDTLSIVT